MPSEAEAKKVSHHQNEVLAPTQPANEAMQKNETLPIEVSPQKRASNPEIIQLDEIIKNNSNEFFIKGLKLFQLGKYDDAEELLTKSLIINPLQSDTLMYLAKIYLMQGYARDGEEKIKAAKRMLEMVLAIDSQRMDAQVLLHIVSKEISTALDLNPIHTPKEKPQKMKLQ